MARVFGFVALEPGRMTAGRFGQLADELDRLAGRGEGFGRARWMASDGRAGLAHVGRPESPLRLFHDTHDDLLVIVEGSPHLGAHPVTPAEIAEAYRQNRFETMALELEGGYAIVIADPGRSRAMIWHDRFGIKPFFHAVGEGIFYFGSYSSLLSLALHGRRRPDPAMVARFAAFHYSHIYGEGATFYDGVRQGMAATVAGWDGEALATHRYWRLDPEAPFLTEEDEDRLAGEFEEILVAAIRNRVTPGPDTGFSLSGGMDSTTILAYCHRLFDIRPQGVSVTYHEAVRANEYPLIKPTADRFLSTWHNVQPTAEEFWNDFPGIYDAFDHPWPTATLYAQDRMFGAAAEAGIRTLVTGSGGDHHQAGDYPNFLHHFANLRYDKDEALLRHEVDRWVALHSEPPWIKTPATVTEFFDRYIDFSERGRLRDTPEEISPPGRDVLTAAARAGLRPLPALGSYGDYLRTYVVKEITRAAFLPALSCEDIMAWRHGVNDVGPFWDVALFEFSWRLPQRMKIRDGINKHLMRRMTAGIVPDHIRLRTAKTGFNLPFESWIRHPRGTGFLHDIFGSATFRTRGLCDADTVDAVLADHLSGRSGHGMLLWQLANLELWYRAWIDGAPIIDPI